MREHGHLLEELESERICLVQFSLVVLYSQISSLLICHLFLEMLVNLLFFGV